MSEQQTPQPNPGQQPPVPQQYAPPAPKQGNAAQGAPMPQQGQAAQQQYAPPTPQQGMPQQGQPVPQQFQGQPAPQQFAPQQGQPVPQQYAPQSGQPVPQQFMPQPGQTMPQPGMPMQQPPQMAGMGAGRYKVHHSYVWMSSIQAVFGLVIVMLFSVVPVFLSGEMTLGSFMVGGGIVAILGVVLLFSLVIALIIGIQALSYKHLSYEVGPKEFTLYSGIFSKKQVHVPYQRVQSVNQRATLVQRIAGVCTVHIDTAGGAANKAVVVPYLQKADAEKLRIELFARKQILLSGRIPEQAPAAAMQGQSGAYTQAAPHYSNVLDAPAEILNDVRGVFGGDQVDLGRVSYEYGLSNKELIFTGLSNNTGFAVIIVTIIISIFGFISEMLQVGFGEEVIDQGISLATRAFADNLIWAIVGGLIIAAVVIWTISTVGTCILYGGFKAVRRGTRIEVEHGLLQHRFHGVDVDRVQSVIIKQTFIRRLIGYCELSLGKIDAAMESSQEQENQLQMQQGLIIHPFVKMSRVPEILQGIIPEFADVPTETISLPKVSLRRALIRRCILFGNGFWLAIVVAVAQVLSHVFAPFFEEEIPGFMAYADPIAISIYVVCLVIVAIEAWGAIMWFRGSSFGYNRTFMQVNNGGFSRESISFPRKKIQYGFTKTNPFQRLSKVSTVNARTAAGIQGTTMSLLDVSEEDAKKWLEWLIPRGSVVK